jgi:hypothetical protein
MADEFPLETGSLATPMRPQQTRDVFAECVTYGPTGMPEVLVLVDDKGQPHWCPGRVHMRTRREQDGWFVTVDYSLDGRSLTDTVPAHRVRQLASAGLSGLAQR